MFTKLPIYRLTNNIVEMLKVSSTKQSFNEWIYISNHLNSDLDDLPFDVDQKLITRKLIYLINDDILESLNNGSIVDVYANIM